MYGKRLTLKQLNFINYYALGNNGAQSARLAGYRPKSARKTAYRLLNTPSIIFYLTWYFKYLKETENGIPMIPPKYDLIKDLTILGVRKIGVETIINYINLNKDNLKEPIIDFELMHAEDKAHAKAKENGIKWHGKTWHV